MAQQFANYQDPSQDQPSMAHRMFSSPLRAQHTLEKMSFGYHMTAYKTWDAMSKGQGLNWSGVVGLRRLALGEGAGGKVLGSLSPTNLLTGAIKPWAPGAAASLKKHGLLGVGGLLNKSGNRGAGFIGRTIGGGVIEATKYNPLALSGGITKDQLGTFTRNLEQSNTFVQKYGSGGISKILKSDDVVERFSDAGITRELSLKKVKYKDLTSGQRKIIRKELEINLKTQKAVQQVSKMGTLEMTEDFVKSNVKRMKWVRRAAMAGKVVSFLGMASLAFDIGAGIGGGVTAAAGGIADRLESGLRDITNKQMEFGGKVGIGFNTGRSGSERQRALSAIGRGYGGSSGMGSEAGYQHVDSTW